MDTRHLITFTKHLKEGQDTYPIFQADLGQLRIVDSELFSWIQNSIYKKL